MSRRTLIYIFGILALASVGIVFFRPFIWPSKNVNFSHPELLRSFLKVTTEDLLNYNSGDYDISHIKYLVSPKIIEIFTNVSKEQSSSRIKFNRRQIWTIHEMRLYYDPKFPQYIAVPLRGEKLTCEDIPSGNGFITKTSSEPTLMITYLQQKVPSPENPWGLFLVGICEVLEKDQAKSLWNMSVPISDAGKKQVASTSTIATSQENRRLGDTPHLNITPEIPTVSFDQSLVDTPQINTYRATHGIPVSLLDQTPPEPDQHSKQAFVKKKDKKQEK